MITKCLPDYPPLESHQIFAKIAVGFDLCMNRQGKDVLLIVDDFTRPNNCVMGEVYDSIVSRVGWSRVAILVASGMHRATTIGELERHIGRPLGGVRIYTHNPFLSNSPWGILKKRFFCVGVGTVLPHTHVEFSGGPKLICPGIANIQTAESFHGDNPSRYDYFIDFLDILVNSTVNQYGEPTSLFVGDPRSVWDDVRVEARKVYSVEVEEGADGVILEPIFRNQDFIQSMNALQICKNKKIVKDRGVICIKSNTPDGIGVHYLFQQPNGLMPANFSTNPKFKKMLGNAQLSFICPNVSREAVNDYFDHPPLFLNSVNDFFNYMRVIRKKPEIVYYKGSDVMIGR
jgi:hypothetical protein